MDWNMLGIMLGAIEGVIAMLANAFVLLCFALWKNLRTTKLMLLGYIAVCDLLNGLVAGVLYPLTFMLKTQKAQVLCVIGVYLELTAVLWQFCVFGLMALERRSSICRQFSTGAKWSGVTLTGTVLVLWIVFAGYNTVVFTTHIEAIVPKNGLCVFTLDSIMPDHYVFTFLVIFLLTLTVLTLAYVHIGYVTFKSRTALAAFTGPQLDDHQTQTRITKMMLMTVGVFFLLYIPMGMTTIFIDPSSAPQWKIIVFNVAYVVYQVNFWINPFIYAGRNKKFRVAFKDTLKTLKCICFSRNQVGPAPTNVLPAH